MDIADITREGLINSAFQPTNSLNAGDLTGFDSKLRINQTFPRLVGVFGAEDSTNALSE